MWENDDYTLQFESNPFYRHEQIILAEGTCEGFLPMTFLRGDHGLIARYEPHGFQPLSRFQVERTEDALYIMEKTITILHTSPEHLLQPERITLRTDTVFYHKRRDDLKIAFLPQPASENLPQDLLHLLAQLRQDLRDQYAGFVLRLAHSLYHNCHDTGDILLTIGLLRRELNELTGPRTT